MIPQGPPGIRGAAWLPCGLGGPHSDVSAAPRLFRSGGRGATVRWRRRGVRLAGIPVALCALDKVRLILGEGRASAAAGLTG